jgi:hypothetical protein
MKAYIRRDPDANLNNYETFEIKFDSISPMTVKEAATKAKDELDLNDGVVSKMVPYVNGMVADWSKVLEDEDMIMLKTQSKDNG